jgi:hypothetical protein
MKLTTKKIIAREFLTLTLVLTLGLISFLCTYPYNAFKRNQVENKSTEISERTKLTDSLSISYKSKLDKQNWFFEKFSNHYDLTGDTTFNTRAKVWKMLDYLAIKDSIKYKWEKVWDKDIVEFNKEIGFSNPEVFHSFIDKNRLTKIDSLNYDSSLAINSEVALLSKFIKENESKILSYNEQTEFGIKALIICFIILFGFRYLFYSLKWSLKTLKQKSE